ncbi:MAG: hypothetical protein V2I43_14305 [Parvularcula sp.]|nr:hypothetical protein [Parvularcula sp.]
MTIDPIALAGGAGPLALALTVGALGTLPFHLMRRRKGIQLPADDIVKALYQLTAAVQRLQDAKAGIIDAMEDSLAKMDRGFDEIERKRVQVEDLADLLEGQAVFHQKRCDEAIKLSEAAVTPLLKRAEEEIRTLRKVVELAHSAREERGTMQEPPPKVHDLLEKASSFADHPIERPILTNPFLRAVGER